MRVPGEGRGGGKWCVSRVRWLDTGGGAGGSEWLRQGNGTPVPEFSEGVSHCNQSTCSIANAVGADASPLGNSKGAYSANDQVRNLEKASQDDESGWRKINLSDAQKYANDGSLVIIGLQSSGHGHTVTVRPDPANGNSNNPSLAQVGGLSTGNGPLTFRQTFRQSDRSRVEVFVYTGGN